MKIKKSLILALAVTSSLSMAESKYNIRSSAAGVINIDNRSSCKDILEIEGASATSGVYKIKNNNSIYSVYCDMTSQGGGWTLVTAQFEKDHGESWFEGIQGDYDPSLRSLRSFALNSSELPAHSQMTMNQTEVDGFGAKGYGYFNFVYSTGNIDKEVITSSNGIDYHIHRNNVYHHAYHNPDSGSGSDPDWEDTLTIDEVDPDAVNSSFNFAYGIHKGEDKQRGFAYKGVRANFEDDGAWTVWVR